MAELKMQSYKIGISLLIFLMSYLAQNKELTLALILLAYLLVAFSVIKEALVGLKEGSIFNESFLMFLASIGAFVLREYTEAFAVMWLYQLGELFQNYAVFKTRRSVTNLLELTPETVLVYKDGKTTLTAPEEVAVGSELLIKPGARIALDAKIIQGQSYLDQAALSGETLPIAVGEGDTVLSGSINLQASLIVKVIKSYENSTLKRIMNLVEEAASQKSEHEEFIDKFAHYYTPAVIFSALALAIIPPLFKGNFLEYLYRACSFLVISCPCALVISIPLTFFSGIGKAAKAGILFKGSNYLELLTKVKVAVFDKTGTLTKGEMEVADIETAGIDKMELLRIAVGCESYSDHPLALSLRKAYPAEIGSVGQKITEYHGKGIKATFEDATYYLGNAAFMAELGITYPQDKHEETLIYISKEKEYLGTIFFKDRLKEDAQAALQELKKAGIKLALLSGDKKETVNKVAKELAINYAQGELLPEEKLKELKKLQETGGISAYIGDGINDAPTLIQSDIGIAMGILGSDAAIEAADIVISDDALRKLPLVLNIAAKTMKIVKENIVLVLLVKLAVLLAGAFGKVPLWLAVFADVGIAFIAIINAIRALH